MELKLDRDDLATRHKNINCSLTKFEHFKLKVQSVIRLVGSARFETRGGSSYNKIYPPK